MNKKVILSIMARGLVYASGYLYLVVANKFLGLEVFGKFVFSQALAEVSLLIVNSAAGNYYSRVAASSLSKVKYPSLYDTLKVGLLPGAAFFLISYYFKYKWIGFESYFFLMAVVLQAVNNARMGYLKGCGEFVYGNIEPSIRAVVTSILMFCWASIFGGLDLLSVSIILTISNLVVSVWLHMVIVNFNIGEKIYFDAVARLYLTMQSILSFTAKKSDILLFSMVFDDSSIGRLKILLIFSEMPYQFFQNYMSTKIRDIATSGMLDGVSKEILRSAIIIYFGVSLAILVFSYAFKNIMAVPSESEIWEFFPMLGYFFIKILSNIVENILMYKSMDRVLVLFSVCEAGIKIIIIAGSKILKLGLGEIYSIMAMMEFTSATFFYLKFVKTKE